MTRMKEEEKKQKRPRNKRWFYFRVRSIKELDMSHALKILSRGRKIWISSAFNAIGSWEMFLFFRFLRVLLFVCIVLFSNFFFRRLAGRTYIIGRYLSEVSFFICLFLFVFFHISIYFLLKLYVFVYIFYIFYLFYIRIETLAQCILSIFCYSVFRIIFV